MKIKPIVALVKVMSLLILIATNSRRDFILRIDRWRKSIQDLLDGKEDTFLLRAEEHTAQIGDKLDPSDLYSPAELHELQFQDLPVPDSTSVINSRSSLPNRCPVLYYNYGSRY